MKRFCIYTVSIGDYYNNIGKITHPIIKKYADKIGADFIIEDKQNSNFITQKWQKFQIYNLLNKYERVLYLDTDIIIRDDCPNLFDIVPDDKLGMFNEGKYAPRLEYIQDASKVYEIDLFKWNQKFYNSGVMVISRIHKQLFKLPPLTDTIETDQPYLNLKIAVDKIEMFDLSYKFNRMDILDKETGISRYDSYILHYAGAPQNQLFPILINDIKELNDSSPYYEKYSKQSIVIKVSAGMGDQLCAEPVIRYIRNTYFSSDNIDITVVSHHPRLFEHIKGITLMDYTQYKDVRGVLELSTTPDDEHSPHGMSHVMFHPTDFASMSTIKMTIPLKEKPIKLNVHQEDIDELIDIVGDKMKLEDLILVHPGRWWNSKTFPLKWWQEVVDGLSKSGHKLAIVGKTLSTKNGEEQGYQNIKCPKGSYDFRNLTSLGGMIALIGKSKCILTNDSSPLHIAGAFRNWIVVIPTAKHPDHILPFRVNDEGHIEQYYKSKALYKKLTIDDLDLCWLSENPDTIDKVVGDILDYIPEPSIVIDEINNIRFDPF